MRPLSPQQTMVLLCIARLGMNAQSVRIKQMGAEELGQDLPQGSISKALQCLESESFVTYHVSDPRARGGRRFKMYQITESGLTVLAVSGEFYSKIGRESVTIARKKSGKLLRAPRQVGK